MTDCKHKHIKKYDGYWVPKCKFGGCNSCPQEWQRKGECLECGRGCNCVLPCGDAEYGMRLSHDTTI